MDKIIHVAILDDHQGIIDGYRYRLENARDIEVVDSSFYGESLSTILKHSRIDVLILDVHVPTSATNSNPYPILAEIPRYMQIYPDLAILVISMDEQPALIRAVLELGASGYITKDDQESIQRLDTIIRNIVKGENYLSLYVVEQLNKNSKNDKGKSLSPRQLEVLSLCAAYPDATTAEMAKMMSLASSSFRNQLSLIYLKLDVRSRSGAVAKAQQLGFLTNASVAS